MQHTTYYMFKAGKLLFSPVGFPLRQDEKGQLPSPSIRLTNVIIFWGTVHGQRCSGQRNESHPRTWRKRVHQDGPTEHA